MRLCRTAEYDESAENPTLGRADIMAAAEGSLRRLQTDRIDLFGLHWPARYVPIFGETQFKAENYYDAPAFEEQVQVRLLPGSGKLVRTLWV